VSNSTKDSSLKGKKKPQHNSCVLFEHPCEIPQALRGELLEWATTRCQHCRMVIPTGCRKGLHIP